MSALKGAAPGAWRHSGAASGTGATNGQPHDTTVAPLVNPPGDPRADPLARALAERAELARAAGDTDGFWAARRAYLLRQAEILGGAQ